eukprot:3722470-Lingulodinium_polyedra.AAC.1
MQRNANALAEKALRALQLALARDRNLKCDGHHGAHRRLQEVHAQLSRDGVYPPPSPLSTSLP